MIIPGASASIAIKDAADSVVKMDMKFFAVSVDTGKALIDVSSFGDTWRQRIGSLKDLSGTLTGYATRDVAESDPTTDWEGKLTITFDTGCSIKFDAIFGQRTLSADVNGAQVVTISYSKTGSAEPTIAWDVTP